MYRLFLGRKYTSQTTFFETTTGCLTGSTVSRPLLVSRDRKVRLRQIAQNPSLGSFKALALKFQKLNILPSQTLLLLRVSKSIFLTEKKKSRICVCLHSFLQAIKAKK